MNTLCTDLSILIDNYLNIVYVSLLQYDDKIIELDPSKELKVWLHMFDKGYVDKPLKILYKKGDVKTLQFISHHYRYREILNMYFELLNIKNGIISITPRMDAALVKGIIKYACKHDDLNTIKEFRNKGYYFETGPYIFNLYKYAYKYRCAAIIDYVNLIGNLSQWCKAVVIIGSDWKDLNTVKEIFLESYPSLKLVIIGSCIKYKRYDVINYLLQDYQQESTYNQCRSLLISLVKYDGTLPAWSMVRLYMKSLKYQDDEFSLLLIDFINYEGILKYTIINGGSDLIVDKVLQKWPQQARDLQFNNLCSNYNIKCTIKSFIKIKEYRGGFSAQDIQHLTMAFMISGRYDLLTTIMTI